MESKIYKDIAKYDKKAGGLSIRQLLGLVGMIFGAFIGIKLCQNVFFIFDDSLQIMTALSIGIPFVFYGFFVYEGDNFETILKNLGKYFVRTKFIYK